MRDELRVGRRERRRASPRCTHSVHTQGRGGATADRRGGRERGGAHPEHAVHVCDAGSVEAQRLVEALRVLSRVASRAYIRCVTSCVRAGRRGRRRATAGHAACAGGKARLCAEHIGTGRGKEHTQNMRYMLVTPEVSQPEMSALKLCKWTKSQLMSVTPETHHSHRWGRTFQWPRPRSNRTP